MLSITNEVDPLIFRCVCFVCDTNMYFSNRYIYPTVGYKQWLEDEMKWILRDEEDYMMTSKKVRRTE